MNKNISIEVEEVNTAIASGIAKTMNDFSFNKIEVPVSWLLPPGTVKAPAKTTVAINITTTIDETIVFCQPLLSFLY